MAHGIQVLDRKCGSWLAAWWLGRAWKFWIPGLMLRNCFQVTRIRIYSQDHGFYGNLYEVPY